MKKNDYEKKLEKVKSIQNDLAKIQRERDLKIDTINNEYDFRIENLMRRLDILMVEIEGYRQLVEKYPDNLNSKNIVLNRLNKGGK